MPDLLRVLLACILVWSSAQTSAGQSAAASDSPSVVTISGRVLDAKTGTPITGATVHFRGDGNVRTDQGSVAPSSLQGEVTTRSDGIFTTPPLPSFGDFSIRASAPSYFASQLHLQAIPGKTSPDMRLEPDLVELRPMSPGALANFALPLDSNIDRQFLAGAFTSDGNRLAFLTRDVIGPRPVGDLVFEPFHRCAAWVYDLTSGVLSSELGLAQRACEVSGPLVWNGDSFFLPLPSNFGAPTAQAAVVTGRFAETRPVASLPKAVQDSFSLPVVPIIQDGVNDRILTSDGLYSIEDWNGEGRGSCDSLKVISTRTRRVEQEIPNCLNSTHLVDRNRDLLVYTQPAHSNSPNHVENIVELDLRAKNKRIFALPMMNHEPELLAEQFLLDGLLRVAYTIRGDCDPHASDYSQPSQPDGVRGNTPNQFSVCFIAVRSTSRH